MSAVVISPIYSYKTIFRKKNLLNTHIFGGNNNHANITFHNNISYVGKQNHNTKELVKYELIPITGHSLDFAKCNRIDQRVLKYLKYNYELCKNPSYKSPEVIELSEISHLWPNAFKANTFNKILTSDLPRSEYVLRDMEFKKCCHWGQLKLHITETELLTLAMQRYRKKFTNGQGPEIIFVYAGAAPGHHIPHLASMFPDVTFHLYDPNEFSGLAQTINKFGENVAKRLNTYVQFFTEADAERWRSEGRRKYIIFCSDIRINNPIPEMIADDMKVQLVWNQIILPELSMFKFRLPWNDGQTLYVKGDIYIQPYPQTETTETRLIVQKDAPLIEYDNRKYEQQMFWHNCYARNMHYTSYLGDNLSLEIDGLDNCYDCTRFINVMYEYLETMQLDKITSNNVKDDTKIKNEIKKSIDEVIDNIVGTLTLYEKTAIQQNKNLYLLLKYCMRDCKDSNCKICIPTGMSLEKYMRRYFAYKGTSIASREKADQLGIYDNIDEE